MKIIIAFCFIVSFSSCKKEEKVVLQSEFVFAYTGMQNLSTFKFTKDTVFVSHNYPSRIKGFFYLMNNDEKTKINEYINAVKHINYKKEYINEYVEDGLDYQFEFLEHKKRIYVQNFESDETKTINDFANYLINLSNRKEQTEHSNLKIDFGNTVIFFRDSEPCLFE
ncbi:hypothetical protein MG290_07505 [Flavobacterium sp. CBA20B-1]|uniref:hypothetical protein n=1 Tax=unclassified Flavobacterium TaxID=196869 RepID=UPI0022251A0B|nr:MULTISPECIES: hypothetical protein [unclassified Flavobacterium]WCM40824.1 hypothetical protein MG290_07505 [Flavobacterium sp. CBA20B-1]